MTYINDANVTMQIAECFCCSIRPLSEQKVFMGVVVVVIETKTQYMSIDGHSQCFYVISIHCHIELVLC